ncbi:hypothetical protein TIFTF001_032259 [Ficus carica]|uniref:Uncharacterized protein n=1 Tax=Ficus carica TaxID=3494 RepID=A0AA88J5J7_FICCA|nr:hypothetical protein TIFTF001_032259 [Ficus carica]
MCCMSCGGGLDGDSVGKMEVVETEWRDGGGFGRKVEREREDSDGWWRTRP